MRPPAGWGLIETLILAEMSDSVAGSEDRWGNGHRRGHGRLAERTPAVWSVVHEVSAEPLSGWTKEHQVANGQKRQRAWFGDDRGTKAVGIQFGVLQDEAKTDHVAQKVSDATLVPRNFAEEDIAGPQRGSGRDLIVFIKQLGAEPGDLAKRKTAQFE